MKLAVGLIVATAFAVCLTSCGTASIPFRRDAGPALSAANLRSPRETATVIFTLDSSGAGTINERVAPSYVSGKTRYIFITINGAPQGQRFPCNVAKANYHCKFVLSAPTGKTKFSVMEYGDSGDELAVSTFVRNVKPGTNRVKTTLHGIVGTVELSIADPFYFAGRPAKQEITVTALDYGGAVIVGSDAYDKPITVQNSDRSGSTRLSSAKLTSPMDRLYITYSGKGCGRATVTAGKTTLDYPKVTFDPEIVPSGNYPVPAGAKVVGSNIVLGNDGALWFTELRAIGRITTSGHIQTLALARTSYAPQELTVGPDGHIWFEALYGSEPLPGGPGAVERVNDDGTMSPFPLPTPPPKRYYYSADMISGPQNELWIAYGDNLYSLTTTGAYTTEYSGDVGFSAMTQGSDGNIWMAGASNAGNGKYRYTPGGTAVRLGGPIAAFNGSEFVDAGGTLYLLGINGAATVDDTGNLLDRFAIPGTYPEGTASVGAGSIWIPMPASRPGYPSVGRISLNDHSTCSYVLPILDGKKYAPLSSVAIGADGKLWFASDRFLGKAPIPAM